MIRRANIEDINVILSIVYSAQLSLRELGIDQWQDGYPQLEVIERDIARGVGYVYIDEGVVAGYAAIIFDGEEAYRQIEAKCWNTAEEYVAIHRICVGGQYRRRGIAVEFMRHAARLARDMGFDAFRIDTHRGNVRMLTLLAKLGFAYVGIVRYDSGERMAFDLELSKSNTL